MAAGFTSDSKTKWLVGVFLVIGVFAPTAAVLWFMNEAAESQSQAARQSLMEAYRGQLRLIRDNIDSYWEGRAIELAEQAGRGTPEDFARLVKARAAESLILFRADGVPSYPSALSFYPDASIDRSDVERARAFEQGRNWAAAAGAYGAIAKSDAPLYLAARAAQSHIRILLNNPNREDRKEESVRMVFDYFSSGRLVTATDGQSRMLAADEYLLALRLMKASDPRRPSALQRLTQWVNDYRSPMPSSQRLFLMAELRDMGVKIETFPTYTAESLAARALEAEAIHPGFGLEPSRASGLWKLTAKGGKVVALLSTEAVRASTPVLSTSQGLSFEVLPPGSATKGEAIAAGPFLPGWQIAFSLLNDHALQEAAARRKSTYLWAGYSVIAILGISGVLLSLFFRRQLQLARLKTDLAAAVSHELKTPLASMRLLVDSLLDDQELDPTKTREYLSLISGENLRLTRLIENFLTFSRLERNRQQFDFTETSPASVVETASSAVHERFEQPDCHLDIQVEEGLPAIQADNDGLVTVLINLLDNAHKYTRGEKFITLRAYREQDKVVFEVRDNGIGIAPREQRRIFHRFYQVDQRLARETGGCGLGLSIVDSIVRAHGGNVSVQSRLGEGSTFIVSLPRAAA